MNSYKLRVLEAIFLVLTICLANVLLQVPSLLVSNTGSSTLLNISYITIIALLFFFIIYLFISKFPGLDIIDISEYLGGKFFKILVCIIYLSFLVISSSIMIRLFAESISLIYFSHLNIDIIVLVFVIASGILNYLGLKSICRLNMFTVPIMLFSMIFLFFSSINNYTYERVFPILGYGVQSTFVNGLSNIFSFGGIFLLFLIFPFLNKISEFKKVGVFSIIIYSVFLLLGVSALLFSFPQVSNTNSPLSLYLLARQISLGEYIQSIDAFFLLIWIPFFLSYLSIIMNFSLLIFKKMTNIKYPSGMVYCLCSILFITTLIINNMDKVIFFSNYFYEYITLGFVFVFNFIILLFAFIKKIIKLIFNKEEKISNV